MHVLQVITDTDRRGAQVFAADLGDALASRGRSVRTVALAAGRDEGGLPVPVLGIEPLGRRTLRALRREARHARVVVAHGSRTLPAGVIATTGLRAPLVYRSIGDPVYWASTPKRRMGMRVLLRRPARVVALWDGSAASLAGSFGVRRERIRIIPRGTPAGRFPVPGAAGRAGARRSLAVGDGPVVVYVGSLSPEKNVEAAIRAVGAIDGASLLIVGNGPKRGALEDLAATEASGRVRFLGALETPATALAASDALVLPSRTEGMPGVLIEAGLSGLPVVATEVGAVRDVVGDDEGGRVVPPGDQAALTEALRAVLLDPDGYGERARARCLARFEMDIVAGAWDELLGEVGAWR